MGRGRSSFPVGTSCDPTTCPGHESPLRVRQTFSCVRLDFGNCQGQEREREIALSPPHSPVQPGHECTFDCVAETPLSEQTEAKSHEVVVRQRCLRESICTTAVMLSVQRASRCGCTESSAPIALVVVKR